MLKCCVAIFLQRMPQVAIIWRQAFEKYGRTPGRHAEPPIYAVQYALTTRYAHNCFYNNFAPTRLCTISYQLRLQRGSLLPE